MRSQWTRAWLLGPLGAATFETKEAEFADVVKSDGFAFLKKALVWFQAEKTTPNPNILASNLPKDQVIRVADILGWPSDFSTWRRFIEFLLARVDTIPIVIYPHIVSVFEVWQNPLAGIGSVLPIETCEDFKDYVKQVLKNEETLCRAAGFSCQTIWLRFWRCAPGPDQIVS